MMQVLDQFFQEEVTNLTYKASYRWDEVPNNM